MIKSSKKKNIVANNVTENEDKKNIKKDSKKNIKDDQKDIKEDQKKDIKKDKKKDDKKKDTKKDKIKNIKEDNWILEVKTTQTGAFKQMIERISNVISDCCIVFIPADDVEHNADDDYYEEVNEDTSTKKKNTKKKTQKIIDKNNENNEKVKKSKTSENIAKNNKQNTGGIRILRLTEDKSILIKLKLDASNFEYFRCDEPKITIGVDMHNLHALLKMINDDDPIILYMNKDNRSVLYIRSLNENNESSEETDIEVFLMEIPNPEMPIPPTEFQNKITIASDKFHNICKHLNNNSTHVEIRSVNNEILFRGQNDGGKVTKSYKDINENNKKKDKSNQVIQGLYELRNLMSFSKCNKLCNTIDIYLRNDFPLVLVIAVATLGKMYVFLSPIENPNN